MANHFLKKIRVRTIRARLFLAFVVMAVLAVVGNTSGTFIVGFFDEQEQALRQLDSVALSKSLQLSAWTEALQNELMTILTEEYAADRITVTLSLAGEQKYYQYISGAVRERLRLLAASSKQFEEYFLLDLEGNVVLSTDPIREGINYSSASFFQRGLNEPFSQLPFQSEIASSTTIFIARPVTSADRQVLGVLVGCADARTLSLILQDQTGLGRASKTYLVDEHYTRLEVQDETLLSSDHTGLIPADVEAVLQNDTGYSGAYTDYRQIRVIGVARWLPMVRSTLLVEQDSSAALQTVFTTLSVNLVVTLMIILLAVVVSSYISRNIANPLIELARTASQIAGGDLDRQVNVQREDEVGVLASAFNSMTHQVRDLINNLEQRVADRTLALQDANQSLERQAIQLETSAEVSREITSILDITELLKRVVTLISNTFGYDYIHIYLLDPSKSRLFLQASNASGLSNQSLDVIDKGLNCEAVRENMAIHVADVTTDERFLMDENLPDVRAELVVPLRFNQRVIGTLDVQSCSAGAFQSSDELVFQSLGDQIAVAIENARLYNRSRELAILEERTRLAKDLHDSVTQSLYSLNLMVEGWRLSTEPEKSDRVDDYLSRTGQIVQQMLKEMRLMIYEMRPPVLEEAGLLFALRKRMDAVENRAGIQTHLEVENFGQLPPQVEEAMYLIAQEAMNNTLKHASAQVVIIRLHRQEGRVVLKIIDDGIGFDPVSVENGGGYGLVSMKERARQLGGACTVVSSPGHGTTVSITIPGIE